MSENLETKIDIDKILNEHPSSAPSLSKLSSKKIENINMNHISWNPNIEKVVLEISKKSLENHNLHLNIALSYTQKHTILMLTLIILSPLSGTLSLLGFLKDSDIYFTSAISALSSTFSFCSGIIASVIKFGKYDETSNAHKIASSRYFSLSNNITRQLALNRKDRIDAAKYLEWLMNSYDDLYQSSPIIPETKQEFNQINFKSDNNSDKSSNNKCNDNSISDNSISDNSIEKLPYTFSQRQDMNKYSDDFMNYQMKRLNINI